MKEKERGKTLVHEASSPWGGEEDDEEEEYEEWRVGKKKQRISTKSYLQAASMLHDDGDDGDDGVLFLSAFNLLLSTVAFSLSTFLSCRFYMY